MKKIATLVLLIITFVSCTSVEKENLHKLNGYWEINKVIQPDGNEVDFGMNTIYDFYEIDQTNKGIYKKASPQLDGTFVVDDYQEEIEIIQDKDIFRIKFHSEFNDREVTIIEVTSNKLILENPDKKTYFYKRAEAINLLDNESQHQTK